MTDKEAYELMVKWGGEKSLSMAREMIHVAGVDKTVLNMRLVYEQHGHTWTDEWEQWMRQAFQYLIETSEATN